MFLYTTSSISINNYFSYKMQSKFLSGEKEQNYLKHVNFSSLFFLDSFLNSNFFRAKALFHLMTYFCYVKYVTTALIKEAK